MTALCELELCFSRPNDDAFFFPCLLPEVLEADIKKEWQLIVQSRSPNPTYGGRRLFFADAFVRAGFVPCAIVRFPSFQFQSEKVTENNSLL